MSTNIPSPRDKLGGCVWLPRILAKARLLASGELPPGYAERFCHPTGVDNQFITCFKLTREEIVSAARLPDEGVVAWFTARPEGSAASIEKWNNIALNLGRPGYPLNERFGVAITTAYKHVYQPGMTTIFELLEADDKIV